MYHSQVLKARPGSALRVDCCVDSMRTELESSAQHDPLLRVLLSLPALWMGTVLALLSVADAFRNAVLRSLDFQWSPAWLLTQHVDPWAVYLAGDPGHQILLNQVPNYLHELYVGMLPFGYMPYMQAKLLWAALNFCLIVLICTCIARLYELCSRRAWLLTIFVLTGTPFRVVIGNGQVTALVLACLALWAVVASAGGRGLLLGLSYAKYSVAPVLAIFLLLRRRWRLLVFSLPPPLAGFLLIFLWLPTPAVTLLLEPFRAASNNVSPGLANIMAVAEIVLRRPPLFHTVPDAFYLAARTRLVTDTPYVCGLLLALAMAAYFFWRGRYVDGRIQMACLTASSLLCFKHQIYDFLLLIFCLALALQAKPSRARTGLLLGIGYFWYAERLVHIHRWEFWPSLVMASFVLLLALIAAAWKLRDSVTWTTPWEM